MVNCDIANANANFCLKPLKQNVLTRKNRTVYSSEVLLVQPNTEQEFLGDQNVTVNFHELKTHTL